MGRVKVCVESSRSRSGLHKRRVLFFTLRKDCEFLNSSVIKKYRAQPMYADGTAECLVIDIPENAYVVIADFRMNPKSVIKGGLKVLDCEGAEVGRAVYRKLKVRVTYAVSGGVLELIKCVFHRLKLPVKRYGIIHGGIKDKNV